MDENTSRKVCEKAQVLLELDFKFHDYYGRNVSCRTLHQTKEYNDVPVEITKYTFS